MRGCRLEYRKQPNPFASRCDHGLPPSLRRPLRTGPQPARRRCRSARPELPAEAQGAGAEAAAVAAARSPTARGEAEPPAAGAAEGNRADSAEREPDVHSGRPTAESDREQFADPV